MGNELDRASKMGNELDRIGKGGDVEIFAAIMVVRGSEITMATWSNRTERRIGYRSSSPVKAIKWSDPSTCPYNAVCTRFLLTIGVKSVYLEPKYDMCYCTNCHGSRGDKTCYPRGKPAKNYALPIGWCRYTLKLPPKAEGLSAFNNWHRAFHGTEKETLPKIIESGELLMPGDVAPGGRKVAERPGHFDDDSKPDGFDTKKTFVSPSISYAGNSAYASSSRYTDSNGEVYNAKIALQVLIRPGSYQVGKETIGACGTIDPLFGNDEIEWSTKERGIILYGILIKMDEE